MSETSAPDAGMDDDDHTVPEDAAEYEDDERAGDDARAFVLAPTPAQLGRAPLQRRLGGIAINGMHAFAFAHSRSII